MKLIRAFAAMFLAVSLLVLSVSAVAFYPSIERMDGPQLVVTNKDGKSVVGAIKDKDGNVLRDVLLGDIIITPLAAAYEDKTLDADIKKTLLDAEKELEEKTWTEIYANFEQLWKTVTGGAPLTNAKVADIYDVRVINGEIAELLAKDGVTITISYTIQGITKDTNAVILHKIDGKWHNEEFDINDDGVITIAHDTLSPFAFVKDTEELPAVPETPETPETPDTPATPDEPGSDVPGSDVPDSPQTGVAGYSVAALAGIVVFSALAVVFAKKTRATVA